MKLNASLCFVYQPENLEVSMSYKLTQSAQEKAVMIRILLNQGSYLVHRYKYSKTHLVELANQLKKLGCVTITREGSKLLQVKRKIKPEQMIEKMVKHDYTRKVYLSTLVDRKKPKAA